MRSDTRPPGTGVSPGPAENSMIWLLEDDDNIRKLLRFSLERERYPVREFADPSSFWEGLRSEIPELIFLDILLPEENGFHILERLRQTEETARIPVIVLTANAIEGVRDRFVLQAHLCSSLCSRAANSTW